MSEKMNLNSIDFSDSNFEIINSQTPFSKVVLPVAEEFIKKVRDGVFKLPKCPMTCTNYPFGYHTVRCRRPMMEDKYNAIPSFALIDPYRSYGKDGDAYFAVYDGHNGAFSSSYAAAHFPQLFKNEISEHIEGEDLMKEVLKVYDTINLYMSFRAKRINAKSGTTVAGVYIRREKMYMFWCGDSVISIVNKQGINVHSRPHKPELPEERARIEAAGGILMEVAGEIRVNGMLNLSRSMGEVESDTIIISKPDYKMFQMREEDLILLLATDGIWDVFDIGTIHKLIIEFVKSNSVDDSDLLAEYIISKAMETNKSDNMTLITVFLRPLSQVWKLLSEVSIQ